MIIEADQPTGATGPEFAPAELLLSIDGLTKRFPGVTALDGVHLGLQRGEVHALAGENGAGKSSLIKILAGIYRPDAGRITLEGRAFAPQTPLDAIRAGIRVVHQEFNLLPYLSVAENLQFERLPRRRFGFMDRAQIERRALELLAEVGLEDVSPWARLETLGVAQLQLVEIAKALSTTSRILILDEPTSTLTPRESRRLFDIIRRLRTAGVTVVYVSHHLSELFELCDRVTVLRNGRAVATQAMRDTDAAGLVRMMVGRALAQGFPARQGRASAVEALRVEDLESRAPSGQRSKQSFLVRYGEIVGLAGLVGAGRTEAVRAIFGADQRRGGRILRDGREVAIRSPRDAVAAGMCLLTENRKDEGLVLPMSARVNITLADVAQVSWRGLLRPDRERSAAEQMRRDLDIRVSSVEQIVRELSGGNQQKVVLAKWLLRQDARVIILDEPTRGIDVGAKAEIYALLNRLADDGRAILIVSSELPELMGLCDRILVLSRGALAGELTRDEFDEEAILHLAYSAYVRDAPPSQKEMIP